MYIYISRLALILFLFCFVLFFCILRISSIKKKATLLHCKFRFCLELWTKGLKCKFFFNFFITYVVY